MNKINNQYLLPLFSSCCTSIDLFFLLGCSVVTFGVSCLCISSTSLGRSVTLSTIGVALGITRSDPASPTPSNFSCSNSRLILTSERHSSLVISGKGLWTRARQCRPCLHIALSDYVLRISWRSSIRVCAHNKHESVLFPSYLSNSPYKMNIYFKIIANKTGYPYL